MPSRYIPELDGIRAVAVLLVVIAHMHSEVWKPVQGFLGVYLFFVLSGYLITSLALVEEKERGKLSFSAFYIRRTFRIFPLYYLVLAIYVLLIFGLGVTPEKRAVMSWAMPYYLTYFQEVPLVTTLAHPGTLPFYQSWSLGIEEKFYLLWPVVAFLALRGKPNLRLPVTCVLALATPLMGPYVAPYASILAGCALAFALTIPGVRSFVTTAGSKGAYVSLAALLLVQLVYIPNVTTKFDYLFYSVIAACCFAFILLVPTPLNSFLASRPLVAIGKVS